MADDIRAAIADIRKQLDAHVDEFNDGASEIRAVQDSLIELDEKFERLLERVDALQALVLAQGPSRAVRLSVQERAVMRVLKSGECAVSRLAAGTGLAPSAVERVLFSLREKGVAVRVASIDGEEVAVLVENGLEHC